MQDINLDIRSQNFSEIRSNHTSFRETRAGHSLRWKLFLIFISNIVITISTLIAIIAATILGQICIVTGSVSASAVVVVSLTQGLLLCLIAILGISTTYIIPTLVTFVISLLIYLFEEPEGFNTTTFCLSLAIGAIFSWIGAIVVAQCITFTFLACTSKGSFIALFTASLISASLVWVSVNSVQTPVAGGFTLTLLSLSGIIITAFVIAQKSLKGSSKFIWLRPQAVFWSAMGGTSFKEADLSNLDFTGSILANTDLRAKKLYRTCFRSVKGLDRARVNNNYLDLDNPGVQSLLINGCSDDTDFSRLNLQGAYLQGANLQNFQLIETNLNGADLRGTDLQESILVRAIVTGVDFTSADLTGACIKDLSFNSETQFKGVTCDYVYREYENDRPTDRYPPDRNFEPGEFQSLFQKLTNAVELVFKDQVDWRALSFTFDKFRLEDDGLELELKGVEQRGDYWIVKVTHKEGIPRQEVEQKVIATYEDLRGILAAKDQQINQLMGIMENQTSTLQNQAEALRNYSTQPFGNIFNITGSTITNLAGSGQIEYTEAANQVRSIVAQGSDPAQMTQRLQQLLTQFQRQNVATTPEQQAELLRQLILSEAESDEIFKGFLKQQEQQILQGMPLGAIASAIYSAIEQLG